MAIIRENNIVYSKGPHDSLSTVHMIIEIEEAINHRGYKDIILDFSKCTSAFAVGILRLCSYLLLKKASGILFSLEFLNNKPLEKLFINQNWAFLIEPEYYSTSNYKGYRQFPAISYSNPIEQQKYLNKILDQLFSSYDDFQRSDFSSIEWALNEIMDNVLVHAESACGGIIQMETFNGINKKIDFVVSDSGIGIPKSIRPAFPILKRDTDLLLKAVQEGTTNGKGQGNGLFGSIRMCSISGGFFSVNSGGAILTSSEKTGVHVKPASVIFPGTTIYASINTNTKGLLESALKFKDVLHSPVDFIETKYEMNTDQLGKIDIEINPQDISVGSRLSGNAERIKIKNLLALSDINQVEIDFRLVSIISSSFADEFIAKLLIEIGQDDFTKKVSITNANSEVKKIVNKAINQRIKNT